MDLKEQLKSLTAQDRKELLNGQPEKSLNFYLKNITGPYSKTEGPVINFLLILFNKRNDIQINNRCRNRHQGAVKAI